MRGDLEVAELPGAFADGMQELLGIRPPSDALGAMQDIHWADGLFGYFPTYTLGNLYAAQLAEAASRELGDIELVVAGGALRRHPRVHARARAPSRGHPPHARADAPGDGRRAELGRPDLAPRALLHLVVLGAARPRRARRSR